MEQNVIERGLAGADEFAAGHALRQGPALRRKLTPEVIANGFKRGSFARDTNRPALFKLGDKVRARNIHPQGHTRLPRYVRGHVGEIVLVHGCHVFPDSVARDMANEDPQWLYTVRFDGRELWGPGGDPTLKVSVDTFEPYLEKA
jgi:hypothetical protein